RRPWFSRQETGRNADLRGVHIPADSRVKMAVGLPERRSVLFGLPRVLFTQPGVEQGAIRHRLVVDVTALEQPASVLLDQLILVVTEVEQLYVLLRCIVRERKPVCDRLCRVAIHVDHVIDDLVPGSWV